MVELFDELDFRVVALTGLSSFSVVTSVVTSVVVVVNSLTLTSYSSIVLSIFEIRLTNLSSSLISDLFILSLIATRASLADE